MRGELHWRGLAGPDDDVAALSSELHELAAAAYAARDRGDKAAFDFFVQQYRIRNGQITPAKQAAVAAAVRADMPSDVMLKLSELSDELMGRGRSLGSAFAGLFNNLPLMLGLGVALVVLLQRRRD